MPDALPVLWDLCRPVVVVVLGTSWVAQTAPCHQGTPSRHSSLTDVFARPAGSQQGTYGCVLLLYCSNASWSSPWQETLVKTPSEQARQSIPQRQSLLLRTNKTSGMPVRERHRMEPAPECPSAAAAAERQGAERYRASGMMIGNPEPRSRELQAGVLVRPARRHRVPCPGCWMLDPRRL